MASRAELVQYERRFVEVYEQIAANLEETRRYYTKYNTLTGSWLRLVQLTTTRLSSTNYY